MRRSVRGGRVDDDRRVRDRLRARLPLRARRVPAGARAHAERDRRGARGRAARRAHPRRATSRSTSSCAAARAPTSAARRRRCSNRSRATAASRAASRRSRSSRACSASRPSSTTSRRWSTCCRSCSRAAPRTRRSARAQSTGTRLFCLSGNVRRPGVYEVPLGTTLRALIERAGGVRRGTHAAGRAARRRGRHVPAPGRDRPAAHARGRARRRHDARLGRRHGVRRHASTCATWCCGSPRSSATSRAASACRAASAPCARRRRCTASPAAARAAASPTELALHRRGRRRHARRLDLRPRPDRLRRGRVGDQAPRACSAPTPPAPRPAGAQRPPARAPLATGAATAPHPGPVELKIDGRRVAVRARAPRSSSACRELGIDVPTLCYLETLTPANACRVCVVEVEGARVLAPSCSRAAEPGMVVRTALRARARARAAWCSRCSPRRSTCRPRPSCRRCSREYGCRPERYGPPAPRRRSRPLDRGPPCAARRRATPPRWRSRSRSTTTSTCATTPSACSATSASRPAARTTRTRSRSRSPGAASTRASRPS